MRGQLKDLTATLDGKKIVSIITPENIAGLFDELKDKPIEFEIKAVRRKRSLSANAYAWVLIDKIAKKMSIKKTEVYRNAIKEIGGVSLDTLFPTNEIEEWRDAWCGRGIGWMADILRDSTIPGYTAVRLYKGSSAYDTHQMSRLIDALVQDAEALGIDTKPQEEIDAMLQQWYQLEGKK